MYTSENYENDFNVSLVLQQELEPLLWKYKVDLLLTGHMHAYERSCPVYRQKCTLGGTTHIMAGSGGASLDTAGVKGLAWSKYFESDWGYGRVHVRNSTHLLFQWVKNIDGKVHDEVWIVHNEMKAM